MGKTLLEVNNVQMRFVFRTSFRESFTDAARSTRYEDLTIFKFHKSILLL